MRSALSRSFLLSAAALVGTATPSSAATLYWDGDVAGGNGDAVSGGGAGTWDTTNADWDAVLGSARQVWNNAGNDTAVFAGTGGTVTLGTGITAGGLTFNATGYTISGNTLTLGGSTPTITANQNVTITSIVTGSSGFTKSGAGTLTLSGKNTYTGPVVIDAGTLAIGIGNLSNWSSGTYVPTASTSVLASGDQTISSLTAANFASVRIAGAWISSATSAPVQPDTFTNNGTTITFWAGFYDGTSFTKAVKLEVTKSGSNFVIRQTDARYLNGNIMGSPTFSTQIVNGSQPPVGSGGYGVNNVAMVDAGTLSASNMTLNGGSLSLGTSTQVIGSLSGVGGTTVTGSGFLTVGSGGGSGSFSGVISDGLSITKTGTGTQTFGGANTYTGSTTVAAGTLRLGDATALGTTASGTSVSSGATLDLNGQAVVGEVVNVTGTGDGAAGALISSSGNASLSGAVTLLGNTSIGGAGNLSLSGAVGGAFALTKVGNGTLTLSSSNSYSGGTVISQGGIIATNAGALGSGSVTIGDTSSGSSNLSLLLGGVNFARAISVTSNGTGTVTLGANGTSNPTFTGAITLAKDVTLAGGFNTDRLTFTGGISGTGNVTITGPGRVLFEIGANTFVGNLTITSGSTLQLGVSSPTSLSFIPDASVLTVAGTLKLAKGANSETIGGLSGAGTIMSHDGVANVASALVINNAGNHTFSGVLSDGGALGATLSLTKNGSGAQTLSGASTYTGTTTVNNGTLVMGNKNAFGSWISGRPVTQVVVNSGGTVNFNGVIDATYGYTISGSGVGGAGALVNNGATIGNATAQASNIRLAADAAVGGTGNWALLTNGFGATTLDLAGNTLTKVGANTFVLVNSTITSGNIRISGGKVALTNTVSSLANVALTLDNTSGVFFENNGNFAVTLGSLAGGGATGGGFLIQTGSLNVGGLGTSTAFAGAITGTGSLTKSGNGTLTLSGNSNYSGGTTLSAGALAIGSNTALGSGSLTIASSGGLRASDGNARSLGNNLSLSADTTLGDAVANGSLTFTGTTALGAARNLTTASDVTLSGIVSGGSLTKLGNGRLTLGGVAHTFSGDLTVSAGSLALASGASLATSKIVMGDTTSLVASAGFTLGSGKQFQLGVSGIANASLDGNFTLDGGTLSFDIDPSLPELLAVTGDLNLTAGTLAFSPSGGAYASGTYSFLTYTGSLTGSVSSLATTGLISANAASRLNFALDDSVAGTVSLVVEGTSASLRWTGSEGATWDAGSSGTANWAPIGEVNYTGETNRFYELDSVTFDDTGSNRTIEVGSAISVGAMTFSNATTDYAFSGAGTIGGLASISKSGAGALDLDIAYTGSGGIALSAGTLRLLDSGFAPSVGTSIAVSGGRLEVGSGVNLGSAALSVTGGTVSVLSSAALGSGLVTLDGGALELAATGTYSKSLTIGSAGATLAALAAGDTTVSSALAPGGTLTLNAAADAVLILSGSLSGSAGLTKTGSGAARLASASAFTGSLDIDAGLLVVESTFGTSGVYSGAIITDGTLSLTSASNQTLSGSITGSGWLAKSGGGTLTLASANAAFAGSLSVTNSTLSLGHSQAAGTAAITLDNATLSRNLGNTTVANNLVVASGGATIAGRQVIDAYTNFSGAISGSGNIVIDGLVQLSGSASSFTGNFTLADSSTYLRFATTSSGSISAANHLDISTGFVRFDGSATDVTYTVGGISSSATTGQIFATNDAGGNNVIIDLAVNDVTRNYSGGFDVNGTNNIRLRKSGSGTQILSNTGYWGFGSGIAQVQVTGGVLELAGSAVGFNTGFFGSSQAFVVSNGGTLRVSNAWNLATGNNVSLNGGTLDVASGFNYLNTLSLANGSTASGSFRLGNTSNATVTSTGDSTNTLSANLSLVNVGARTATFNVADGAQADDLVVSGAISDLPIDDNNISYAGTVVSKTGAGTLVLSGSNTFAGNVSVGAGTLSVTGTLGNGNYAGAITNSGVLAFQSTSNQTLSGLITGSGDLVKSGAGILTISGANSGFSGTTTINAGTLLINNLLALGTGNINVTGGILDLNDLAPTNVITLSGGSLLNASAWASTGVIELSGNVDAALINNLPGEVKITAGTTVNLTGVTKDIVFEGGTLSNLTGYQGKLTVSGGSLDLSAGVPSGEIEVSTGGTVNFGSTASDRTIKFTGGSVTGANFTGDIEIVGSGISLGSGIQAGTIRLTSGNSATIAAGFNRDIAFAGGALSGLNNYTGTVSLETGATLTVDDTTGASFSLASGSKLKGEGTIDTIIQASGSILAPGNSPGLLTTTTFEAAGGAILEVEFIDPTGFAGLGYDAVSATTLDLSELDPANRYVLELISLSATPSTEGPLAGFDASQTYAFDIFTYANLILPASYSGGIAGLFTIDLTRFQDQSGVFVTQGFTLSDTGSALVLNYAPIPEPSTYGLILGGLALAGAAVRRRRLRKSA